MRELGRVVVLVRDGDGGRRRSGQAHFASRHVLGHNFQLVSGGRQRLEGTETRMNGSTGSKRGHDCRLGRGRTFVRRVPGRK